MKGLILLLLTLVAILIVSLEQPIIGNVHSQKTNKTISSNGLLDLFGNGLNSLNNELVYSITLDGNQIFPNSTLKDKIINGHQQSIYNTSRLKYNLLGYQIAAHDIKIRVNPSTIDSTRTRVDIPLMLAKNVTVTDGINQNYDKVNLGSIWGIYDKSNNKMVVHIPVGLALKYLHL